MENCEEVVVNPASEKKPFNVFALLGFIFAIAPHVPIIVGLIFSIIGLKQAKVLGNGKPFAVTGLIVSLLALSVVILYLAVEIVGLLVSLVFGALAFCVGIVIVIIYLIIFVVFWVVSFLGVV